YEIKASGIRDDAARITWTTDIPGTTQVEFGPKKSYGKKTVPDNLPRMNHFADLKGLKRNTTYHYRVMTTDIFGKVRTSGDYTFTTLKAPPAKGQVYYVSTKGDDGNNGLSLKTAWRRIGYAAGRVKAGDTVKIEAGTYEEAPGEPEKSVEIKTGGKKVPVETRSAVNIEASGTDVSPITFEGFKGVPVLDGSKYTKGGTFGIRITGSYVHIRGLKIRGYSIGIRPRGTSHVRISNCEVGPTGSIGIKARNNTYLIIDKCDVHNNGWNSFMLEIDQQPGSQSHHYTITNCKVHDNSAHNLMDITVHFGNRNSHHHFDIINNELYKCTSNGFFTHWDKRPVLRHFNWSNNNLHHNGTHAMRVNALEDSYIYNNTFADNSLKRKDSEISGSCRNVTFYKNSGARHVDVRGDGLLFLRNEFPYIRTGGGLTTIRDNRSGKFSAMRTGKGKMIVEFTDGRVFSTKRTWNNGKYNITEPECL
ncbi:MAG: right-handed parallel beta-helix repeat-containing protein, partial [Phycisphaerae bacterium]|nr:right-handed parallel beta-helix repeat-containing protein [Phycisphaerae bacterium]